MSNYRINGDCRAISVALVGTSAYAASVVFTNIVVTIVVSLLLLLMI